MKFKIIADGGKNSFLPAKERQTRILPAIGLSVFSSSRFHLNCNIVCDVVDCQLGTGITLKASLDHKAVHEKSLHIILF